MRIALLQSEPCHDVDACLAQLQGHLKTAREAGAELLITPEMWLGGYNIPPARIRANCTAHEKLPDLIAKAGIAAVIGCPMLQEDQPRNAALAFDSKGREIARYAKCHLFGALDAERFVPGEALSPVFEIAGLRAGLAICYDIEFPELARTLALQGAQIILVPTANMIPFETVNTRLVPARAEENGIFIAYANLCGREGDLTYCGLSCACAPDGTTLAKAGTTAGLIFFDLDPDLVTIAQSGSPYLKDRRTDLYD